MSSLKKADRALIFDDSDCEKATPDDVPADLQRAVATFLKTLLLISQRIQSHSPECFALITPRYPELGWGFEHTYPKIDQHSSKLLLLPNQTKPGTNSSNFRSIKIQSNFSFSSFVWDTKRLCTVRSSSSLHSTLHVPMCLGHAPTNL